jgi:hypothetical protein
MMMPDRVDPDELARLEEERRFLLRSLDDLEREYAAGDVDDDDYLTLRDGYTARTAAVLRSIEAGKASLPPKRRTSRTVVVAWVMGVVVVAAVSGWLVARSSGQRLSGQVMTGGSPVDEVGAKLAEARGLLGSDPLRASELYGEVLALDSGNAEARTYTAWLLALFASSASTPETAELASAQSKASFEAVIAAQPGYSDAHCLYAVANVRFYPEPNVDLARSQAQLCLDSDPPAEMRALIEPFIDSLG